MVISLENGISNTNDIARSTYITWNILENTVCIFVHFGL